MTNEVVTNPGGGHETVHVFGVRHHGPGSARSLLDALEQLAPDAVLIEGPPDASAELVALAGHAEMKPPVTLLIYDPANPRHAVYYPFAEFSPEWQALLYAQRAGIPSRFTDLPQGIQFAIEIASQPIAAGPPDNLPPEPQAEDARDEAAADWSVRQDPLSALAKAAGYEDGDGERWWERMVEQRSSANRADIFAAVLEAMSVLREGARERVPNLDLLNEERREAFMRQRIRDAIGEGYSRIAVVCGAWHAPVLGHDSLAPMKKADKQLLGKLPRALSVRATWAPWTYGRLTSASGYGAGVTSPGWYEHLWSAGAEIRQDPTASNVAIRWMIRVAHLLREQEIDASSAHVIEAVRLAQCIASLRGHAIPGLQELNEASQTVLCFGNDTPMRLIAEKLIVGDRLGGVPAETPFTPLQQDLRAQQKRLRLAPEAGYRRLELDLRNANDLSRSHLLHRLTIIDVPWGAVERGDAGKGTFHENWRIQWLPEMEIGLIAAGVWGNTIELAAGARCEQEATEADSLPRITALLERVMLADLPDAAATVMQRLSDQAAIAADPLDLMNALPKLVNVRRYGDVRQTDAGAVEHIIDGLVVRICEGLPGACTSLDDSAAEAMYRAIMETNGAIGLLQDVEYDALWRHALSRIAEVVTVNGLVAGCCIRLLTDDQTLGPEEVSRRISLALSRAADPAAAAGWLDGFLRGSGAILAHDTALWSIVDSWVSGLSSDHFLAVLPLVRRTFSTFTSPDRRALAERASSGAHPNLAVAATDNESFSMDAAIAALPTVLMLLGGRANVISSSAPAARANVDEKPTELHTSRGCAAAPPPQ